LKIESIKISNHLHTKTNNYKFARQFANQIFHKHKMAAANYELKSNAPLTILFRNFIHGQDFNMDVDKIPSTYESFVNRVNHILGERGITPPDEIKCVSRGRVLFRELYWVMFRNATMRQNIVVGPARRRIQREL
jgi:hypothetical protein